jgi:hypothetical protein
VFSANGWRRREPAELDLSPEPPTILVQLIKFHRDHLRFEMSQVSQIVNLYEDQFQQWYPLNNGLRLVS